MSDWNDSTPVPYRKPGLEQPATHQPQQTGKNSKQNRKGRQQVSQQQQSNTSRKDPAKSNTNPFSTILSSAEHSNPSMNHEPLKQKTTQGKKAEEPLDFDYGSQEPVAEEPVSGKKKKFTPLFTTHGGEQQILLPGRHPCQCMCTKHDLINNCLNCGRIVCEQEGTGPCFTCRQLVCTPQEFAALRKGGLEAEKLRRKIYGSDDLTLDFNKMIKLDRDQGGLTEAEAHKNKLLEYDRTAALRTKIIDDQADYYNENSFQTREQREAVRQKEADLRKTRFAPRREKNRKFDLDFAGREAGFRSQSETIDTMYADPEDDQIPVTMSFSRSKLDNPINSQLSSAKPRSFAEELAMIPDFPTSNAAFGKPSRLQDRELQELTDIGAALSIMQPWASFVVMGLKPHEGRDWYTAHRGKLWIAAGSKLLPANEAAQEENLVKALMGGEFIVFPEQYLTGFVLGCVNLVDCITQEEYQRRFPGGLLKYPYIMLFDNPMEMEHKFPVENRSKIFKLDHKMHELAKRQSFKKPVTTWNPKLTYGGGKQDFERR